MKYLIAGLGNIGAEFAHTRHNIGFDVVNAFALKHEGKWQPSRLAYMTTVKWERKTLTCICPTTYMNLSGKAVKYWMVKEKIPLERILVIVDEISIPLDKLRLKPAGSAGGHNGLSSVEEALGTRDYPRLRFGIGNNFPRGRQADYVLGKWHRDEEPLVKLKIDAAVQVIETYAFKGISEAMNQVNNRVFSL